jgi:NADH-quinone oxidoreductase subunit A
MDAYLPIAILLVFALCVCGGILGLTTLLGPKNPLPSKLNPYECGVKPEGSARAPFRNRFYMIAVLFLLFDVEAALFFPWALVYRESLMQGPELLVALLVYMVLMVLGLAYIFKKQALELE